MRWHDEKISLPNVPARVDPTIKYSSATHSPKKTKSLQKKTDQKTHHQHEWNIYSNRWVCNVCGMKYG